MTTPDFIIIGAAKAATTWLSTALQQQPNAFMPAAELHFFNRNFGKGLPWYENQFAAARPGQLVGEKSATYLADAEVPARLHRVLPQVRLVVQLRDPVERAYSDYCMLLRRDVVGDDIARYLDPDRVPLRRFLDDGLYASHLACYLKLFPREQIKVVLYDDIERDAVAVFDEVAAFIGLVAPVRPQVLSQRVNEKEVPMLPLPLRRLLAPLKGAVRPWREQLLFRRVRALLARPVCYPHLDEGLRRRLRAFYADDLRTLEGMLGRSLEGWLQGSDQPG
jgi:hypothetical protein